MVPEDYLRSARRVDEWLSKHEFSAYDPFDGLNAWVRPLASGRLARQVLQQAVRRAPINLRPWLAIQPSASSKAMGYLARAYLKLERCEPGGEFVDRARFALQWLLDNSSVGFSGLAWGNHFDYQSRVFYLPEGEPTVVWTSLVGHAFLDAWDQLREPRWLSAARSIRTFIVEDLARRECGAGLCISYIPSGFYAVHNANMLASGFLAREALCSGDDGVLDICRRAVDYTVGCQHPDGSWWYGEAHDRHWIDSFHTGYVIDSLWWYMLGSGDVRHAGAFVKGADFYAANFFRCDGLPKYYAQRTWPVDIQCAAQGVETLSLLANALDGRLLNLAEQVATWTIDHMQGADGHFAYQVWPGVTNRTAMIHWGQATMIHALSCLALGTEGTP